MKNLQKCEKMCDFPFFFPSSNECLSEAYTERQKNKNSFESIPIPKYAFSKNKNAHSLKLQVQRLMKTIYF